MRGLNAPPRRRPAPAFLTSSATRQICSGVSTEQGPAITWKLPPPIFTPLTSTTLSSGWNLRLAFLYGSWMRLTSSTISSEAIFPMSTLVVSPTRPSRVVFMPLEKWTCRPIDSKFSFNFSICSGRAESLTITIMVNSPLYLIFQQCTATKKPALWGAPAVDQTLMQCVVDIQKSILQEQQDYRFLSAQHKQPAPIKPR